MKKVTLDLVINGRLPAPLPAAKVRRIARTTLESLHLDSGELGVAILSEKQMAEKNLAYHKKSGPTDVLSFAYPQPKQTKSLVGDVLICPTYAAKQAKAESIPLKEELARLLIHGFLHLAGFDHAKAADAKRMFKRQEDLLKIV